MLGYLFIPTERKNLDFFFSIGIHQCFEDVVSGPAQPENLLENQILRPYPDLPNQKPWEWGSSTMCLTSPLSDPNAWLSLLTNKNKSKRIPTLWFQAYEYS